MTENPKNSKPVFQNTTETSKEQRHEKPKARAKPEALCRWPSASVARMTRGGWRERSRLGSVTNSSPVSFAFLKTLWLGERDVGSIMDYTTLQKLESTKYLFKEGTNITGLDELSRGKMDRIAIEDDWIIKLKANREFICLVDTRIHNPVTSTEL